MKKSLLITYYFPPKIGGGEDYLYNIYKQLPSDKIVVLAEDNDGKGQTEFDSQQSFKAYREKFFSGRLKPTWWHLKNKVKKIVQEEGIETIHFGHYAHYILLARILKLPYLVYIQGSDINSYTESWFGRWLAESNLKKALKIIAASDFLKNNVVKLGIDKNIVEVIQPGLDLTAYDLTNKGPIAARQTLSLPINKKVILSVGRLVKVKGFDLVIRAMPDILKEIPEAVYVVVGEGDEKDNLKDLARELDVEDKVIFVGEIRDKKELSGHYGSADVYAGPSRAEGFGIVFLEARAFGLPIVASDIGGVREAAGDKGIFIKPEDTQALIRNLIKTLKSDKKFNPEKNFGWEDKIKKIKELFNKI